MERQLSILIIDDDEVDRMAIGRALRKTGLQTKLYEADSIDAALAQISERPWDCVFLDYLLPGGDGLELLKQFRAMGYQMPVIMVTSQGDEKIAVRAMKEGGSDYISKHLLNPEAVAKVLLSAMRTHQAELERERTAYALSKSESRLAEAQRIANIGSWEIDLERNTGYWTEQVFRILGYERTKSLEVSFQRFLSHVHADDLERAASDYAACVRDGIPMITDIKVLTKTGEIRQVEVQGKAIRNDKGNTRKIVGTVQDITHRKSIEQALIEARNMAERNAKAKEEFLANMSHEIRTPMNAILGFGKLLAETPLNPQQQEYLHAIDASGEALLAIINDILDLSKIEAGKLYFEHHPFSLSEMLKSLSAIFQPKAKENEIEFEWLLGPGVPDMLEGSATRLNQVLMNLLGNAFKFTSHGEINIEVKLKSQEGDQLRLFFEVADTGIGIPEDKLESIFESFTQASNDTTRKYGGTGLGLTICKRIVELQGGRIGVQSEPGEGSVFFFELDFKIPSEQTISQTKIQESKTSVSSKSLNVLFAEDNKMNQRLATIVLEKLGHRVRLAETGTQVLHYIQQETPDIVLMDIQMPEMDGYEATKLIRESNQTEIKNLPIIALTAHALREEVDKCLAAGMNAFISKPFQAQTLQAKMLELAGNSSQPPRQNSAAKLKPKNQAIELSQVDEMCGGNADFRRELIDIFLDEVPKYLAKIQSAFKEKEFDKLYHSAHGIKPSLILFGVPDAKALIDLIEEKAKAKENDQHLADSISKIEANIEAAILALKK